MGEAISPQGDMLKNRVPISQRARPCRNMTPFLPEKLSKLIGSGNVPTLIDIRIDVDVCSRST
jgi:hypothetical protein